METDSRLVELFHLGGFVARRDHVSFVFDAQLRDHRVNAVRQQAEKHTNCQQMQFIALAKRLLIREVGGATRDGVDSILFGRLV